MATPSTILIVEDHAANRDTLTELLDNPDFRLVEAEDGPTTLKLAAELLPDLILLDVMMPGMDGFEVCRRLRATPALAEVPVVMVTALDDRESRLTGIRCGADDFVIKPFDSSELRARVQTITRLNRYARLHRERAKVEEATQQIREQAALIDQAAEPIVVTDLAGVVQFWNPGAATMFGTPAATARGQRLADLINMGDSALLERAQAQTLRTGEWRGDLLALRLVGGNVIAHSHWTLLRHPDGSPRSILAVSTDQTEFKQLQAQFFRAQRLESIGALASGVAHDLNNVLAPILMAVELLRPQAADANANEIIDIIETSARRGAGMVEQILSFARGRTDGPVILQVRHLIADLSRMMKDTFPPNIRCVSHVSADLWPVRGDPTQLYQVLLNLCVNARDAMPDRGTITIAANNLTREATLAASQPASPASHDPALPAGRYVVLTVTDNGTGIPPELQQKIFEPFFSTKAPGKGTGLGLATVKQIVTGLGGFLQLHSEVGAGTQFKIHLPATGESETVTDTAKAALPGGNQELVLVVDDVAAVREIIKATLENYGYRVVTANDGTEAVARFVEHLAEVRLLLTDMQMPHLDGTATIRALRRVTGEFGAGTFALDGTATIRALRQLKPELCVVASSGLTSQRDALASVGVVVQGFLAKPFTAETLLRELATALHPQPSPPSQPGAAT